MKRILIVVILSIFSFLSKAQTSIQDFINSKDLSAFKIDMLSDDDIAKYKNYLLNAGITDQQAEIYAMQRGLPASEIVKLKNRLVSAGTNMPSKSNINKTAKTRNVDSTIISKPDNKVKSEIFGADLFRNSNIQLNQNLNSIATPKNYVIGPQDELLIDVFGYQETNLKLTVNPQGTITLPYVGLIAVGGLTIEQASKKIKDKMQKNGYSSIASGQTKVEITIGNIRTIKVTVIGEAQNAGTYTVSSLSNLFNVLYLCGGTSEKGSLRTIELIRNNKVIVQLDVYDFLLKGLQIANVHLEDQDVVRIPIAENLVRVKGETIREGIFEILKGENLTKLISFAGGFTSKAYTASVNVVQYTDKEKRIKDVQKNSYDSYLPLKGDEVFVGKILDRFSNRVVISGAVFRPGDYELTDKLTLTQLIKKSDGLKEDAFKQRALLVRTSDDLTKSVIPFNVTNILLGKEQDIVLQKDDSISIASTKNFKENYSITVNGEVKRPGVYEYFEGITLKDIIFQTGGFTDAASPQHIEVARRIKDSTYTSKIAEVMEVVSELDLSTKGKEIALQPWDIVIIRSNPGYKAQTTVRIEGEVLMPGYYTLSSKDEKVSDIIKRAGGLTIQADKKAGNITRINKSLLKEQALVQLDRVATSKDSSAIEDITNPTVKIGLDMTKILTDNNSLENVVLQEGDVIAIPKQRNVVKINGEVMFPTEVVYKEGASIDYYIDKAGGFTDKAQKGKMYVLHANGSAAKTKHFLGFRNFPSVDAGSEIIVPKKSSVDKKGLSTTEVIALTSGIATLASVIVAIVNITK